MITNHYGITVNSDEPITGVLSINQVNIESLMDSMYYQDGINIDAEERLNEFKSNPLNPDYDIRMDELSENAQDDINLINFASWDTLLESTQDELIQAYYDTDESYPDDTWLIGQWAKDEEGLYIPDKSGDYSAIVRETTIQVVWSKYIIKVNNLCSPCYPGQADIHIDDKGQPIESDDGYMAYNLPDEFFFHNER